MEMIAVLRVASILHLAVVVPMRWLLTANTHKLAECKWGEHSMGRAVDLLYTAFLSIQADGSLLLVQYQGLYGLSSGGEGRQCDWLP